MSFHPHFWQNDLSSFENQMTPAAPHRGHAPGGPFFPADPPAFTRISSRIFTHLDSMQNPPSEACLHASVVCRQKFIAILPFKTACS